MFCRRAGLALLFLAFPMLSCAASWTATVADPRTRRLDHLDFEMLLEDGSFVIESEYIDGPRKWRWHSLFGADAQLLERRNVAHAYVRVEQGNLLSASSGDSSSWLPSSCRLRRGAFAGRDVRELGLGVPTTDLDGAGGLTRGFYPGTEPLYFARVGADCVLGPRWEGERWRDAAADPSSNAAYLLSRIPESAPRVVRVVDGLEQWSHPIAGGMPTAIEHVTVEGDVVLRLQDTTLLTIDATGKTLWQTTLFTPSATQYALEYFSEPGALFVNSLGSDNAQRFLKITRDGRIQWTASGRYAPFPQAGRRNKLSWRPVGTASGPVLTTGDGGFQTLSSPPTGVRYEMRLATGDFLGVANGKQVLIPADGGSVRPLEIMVPRQVHLQALANDERGAVIATAREQEALEVVEYTTDGAVRWRTRLPAQVEIDAPPRHDNRTSAIALLAANVCVVHGSLDSILPYQVACLSREDGRITSGWKPLTQGIPRLIAADAQGIDFVIGPSVQHVTPDGTPGATRAIGEAPLNRLAISRQGHFALEDSYARTVHVYERNGALLYRRTFDGDFSVRAIDESGRALVANAQGLSLLGTDGQTQWTHATPPGRFSPAPTASALALPGGDFIVATAKVTGDLTDVRTRLRGSDGAVVWSVTGGEPATDPVPYAWRLSDDGRTAFRLAAGADAPWRTDHRLAAIDVATGALRYTRAVPEADGDPQLIQGVRVSVDGRGAMLRAFESGNTGEVVVAYEAPPESGTRAADASVLGAWRTADTSGQGLFFDVDAATGLAFGAWFTYQDQPHHQLKGLRWFTLAAVPSAADESRFRIYRSRDGVFSAAADVVSEPVGEATLRLTGCDEAILTYALSVEGRAIDNALPLVRAAPAHRACGSDASRAGIASRGLDPRSSGAWYDPTTSGQGIAFDLAPPANGDEGLFVGAWFTYDPQIGRDDDAGQHWFTLSGSLADAQHGRFSVPIYRTLGGGFDHGRTNNTFRVGTATFTFAACDAAFIDYRFDDTEFAHAYAGLQGRRNLVRVGGCGD